MGSDSCFQCGGPFLYGSLALGGLLLLLLLILAICLCRLQQRVSKLERSRPPEQELHYASLQRLPLAHGSSDRDAVKEDASTYACIAEKKPA